MAKDTTKLLSIISVMMMLSVAFVGASFLTDDATASGSGTANDPYTSVPDYSVLMNSSDVYVLVGAMFGSSNYEINPPDIVGDSTEGESVFMDAGFTIVDSFSSVDGVIFYGEIAQGTYTFYLVNLSSWENHTVTVHTVSSTHTVIYNSDGGTTYNNSTVANGSSITLPTPTKTGYNFKGWYSGSTLIGLGGVSYTPSADITLTAHWEQVLSISSTPSTTSVIKGNTWTYTPTVNTTGYTLSLSSTAPSWLSVNGSTIQGTPGTNVTAGTYTFTVFCQKTGCQTAEQSITLTVVSALTFSNPTLYIIAYEG